MDSERVQVAGIKVVIDIQRDADGIKQVMAIPDDGAEPWYAINLRTGETLELYPTDAESFVIADEGVDGLYGLHAEHEALIALQQFVQHVTTKE